MSKSHVVGATLTPEVVSREEAERAVRNDDPFRALRGMRVVIRVDPKNVRKEKKP